MRPEVPPSWFWGQRAVDPEEPIPSSYRAFLVKFGSNSSKGLEIHSRQINQPINHSINQSINQSVSQSVNQSLNQSINHLIVICALQIFNVNDNDDDGSSVTEDNTYGLRILNSTR